jgi:hypothetical protein
VATSASAASRSGKPKASAHPSVEMALSGLETGQHADTSAAIAALELADPRIYITMYPGEDVGTARQKFRKTINQQVQRRGVVLAERPTPASAAATEGAEQAKKKTTGEDAGRKSKLNDNLPAARCGTALGHQANGSLWTTRTRWDRMRARLAPSARVARFASTSTTVAGQP